MMITPVRRTVKSGVVTGKVPSEGGTYFLRARFPAIASMGMIMRKRPANMANPRVVSYQGVLTVRPAKAEPLFPVPELDAYRISLRPCGPGWRMPEVPYGST